MTDHNDLIGLGASRMVALLDRGAISPVDALEALEARIASVDLLVNALPTLCFDRAHDNARRLQEMPTDERGLLRGLPVPIKDLTQVAGVRTTSGSLLFKDHISQATGLPARVLEQNGAIIYAKSNTPEFGTGGHTHNKVFGITRNPRDLSRSAGGSSGGAAAALATGMAWIAHGSDMAGSLRTPASFCGVASLRPSPGLIASDQPVLPFQVLGQQGPMARNVEDVALMTDAMSGLSAEAGLSKPAPAAPFLSAAREPQRPLRVAVSPDLGVTEIEAEVRDAFNAAIGALEGAGLALEESHPDFSDAVEAFTVQRALFYAVKLGDALATAGHLFNPQVVWNIEKSLKTDAASIRSAMAAQGRLFGKASAFMRDHDLLICPATIMPPFPAEETHPGSSIGVPVSEYYDWLKIVYVVSAATLPVITVPCGFTAGGLPLAIQLIGRPHGEYELFRHARYIEEILGWDAAPIDPVE